MSEASAPAGRGNRKVSDEPGFVLYHIDYRDSSLIVHVLSQNHGVVTLLAKGAKRHYSQLRGVLLPFHELRFHYRGQAEVKLLTTVEWSGGVGLLPSSHLHSAYYLNELVLRFCRPEDPHPEVFSLYRHTLQRLVQTPLSYWLRVFEYQLLRHSGLVNSPMDLEGGERYRLNPHEGLLPDSRAGIRGALWQALAREELVAEVSRQESETLRNMLHNVLQHHLNGRPLNTRLTFRN